MGFVSHAVQTLISSSASLGSRWGGQRGPENRCKANCKATWVISAKKESNILRARITYNFLGLERTLLVGEDSANFCG
jgi:hypothetical protein